MEKSKEIPGFLPEDYDKEPPGIEDMELDATQMYWLKHDQKAQEDGIALGERMSAEYDSYIVIGFKKEKHHDGVLTEHESVCGACHVAQRDCDAVSEISRLLGYYAFKNFEVYKILKKALSRCHSYYKEEENPEPPEHQYLPRDKRFHLNRFNRIETEEFVKVQNEFRYALGDYQLRRDMKMRMVLTAIADQLNNNKDVEIDFFCNYTLGEDTDGDNVSGIKVWDLPYPCTWDEAAKKRDRFVALCKRYDVPCQIVWVD